MVTAELAAALPVLVLLLAVAVSVVGVGGLRVRAQDAAREAARAAARGDGAEGVRIAAGVAPGVHVELRRAATEVIATARLHATLLARWLPGVTITEQAVAALEPGATERIPREPSDPPHPLSAGP